MVGCHMFQLIYLNFVQVTSLLKGIDKNLSTRDKITFLILRKIILNLRSSAMKYGKQKMFQSVAFVAEPTKVWF